MSWLRASRKAIDPDGRVWELYVTRTRIGPWNGMDVPDADLTFGGRAAEVWWVLLPLMVVLELLLGILKLIALVPLSAASTLTRQPLRIEAIVEYPLRETYAWTVAGPALRPALDQIATGLERGALVEPADARYLGQIDRAQT
jgi:hypothetical protein